MVVKISKSDCQIILVSGKHEVYRAINDALRALGLSVMWVQDIASARMLAKTTAMEILLCDPRARPSSKKLFDPTTIRPGASCVELSFPEEDPRGTRFEMNLELARRLIKIVKNLMRIDEIDALEAAQTN